MSDGSILVEIPISTAPHLVTLWVLSLACRATVPLHSAQAQSFCQYLRSSFIPSSRLTIQIIFRLIQRHYQIGWMAVQLRNIQSTQLRCAAALNSHRLYTAWCG